MEQAIVKELNDWTWTHTIWNTFEEMIESSHAATIKNGRLAPLVAAAYNRCKRRMGRPERAWTK